MLSSYWMPITEDYYFKKMDQVMVRNALEVIQLPEGLWERLEIKDSQTGSVVYKKSHAKRTR